MRVERAIFTSDEHRDVRGYHLVARSAGIDDELAQRLSLTAPTHDSLDGTELNVSSYNYCFFNDWAALSRTAYGGPEYSDRGSLRIVTTFLVLPMSELEGFAGSPVLLTRIAMALGLLKIPFPVSRSIDPVEIARASLLAQFPRAIGGRVDRRLIQQLVDSLGDSRPIAIIGAEHPQSTIEHLHALLAEEVRIWISYSTRLKPSINRPYRLQFCGPCDARRMGILESRGFRCLLAD